MFLAIFKDQSHETTEYEYDLNGSLEKDKNKKINTIQYNHLGLAIVVLFKNGDKITTEYDAAGVNRSWSVG